MTDKQPEALRLADYIEKNNANDVWKGTAAELRRLHEAHEWQHKMAGDRLRRIEKLEKVNAELVEVLRTALDTGLNWRDQAFAAIAKATGEQQ